MSSFGLNNVITNVQPLSGIFGTHHLECSEDGRAMHPYINANYMINNLLMLKPRKSSILYKKINVIRSSHERHSMEKVVLKDFGILTGEQLCCRLEKRLNTGVFL